MDVNRISFEFAEGGFSECIRDMAANVEVAGAMLQAAYLGAALRYGFEPTNGDLAYFSQPPLCVMNWTLDKSTGQPRAIGMPFVKDSAMAIFAYENSLEAEPDRASLTKSELRSADGRAQYFASTGRIWQRGRPIEADIPLLLYLAFSIEILIGRRFSQSRPNSDLKRKGGGKTSPGGPAFRLLQAAYSLASVRQHVMPAGAETIYEVARIARSEAFKQQIALCRVAPWVGDQNHGSTLPEIVARHPAQCAYLYAVAAGARRRERN